ncbi:Trigger factor-like protein TIG [Acorus gramineus]|uniref:peptidylprolyl isomerase n=1 Tax=Acorus gramineus TaxID=55184 RepID=A0AAV9AZR6_ACOGR|nr:Trigger factor-like protein TIG [Acorus gramineus]
MALTTSSSIQFKPSLHHLPLPSMPNTPSFTLSFKQSNNPSKLAFSSPSIRRSFHRLSRSLEVSASAVAVQTEKDKSPLDGVRVTETAEPQSRVRLSVEVPQVVCQDCYRRVLEEFSKRTKIPGFRPGKKVPENILINYVGKEYVRRATIESILKRTLPHAMASVEGRALKDSVRVVTKFSKMNEEFSLQDIFRFDVMVDVSPEIKWLSESRYKNLKVVVEIDNSINAQSTSEEELRRRHKALGSLRIVTDRGLELSSYDSLASTETTTYNVKKSQLFDCFHFDTEESDNLLPGFLNSIIGIRPGETKSFPLSFPESWKQENLRGVSAQFTVECKELFYRQLPELDDDIADKLLPGSSTLAQVQEVILQRCKEVEKSAIDQATDNAILDQLSKIVEVPAIPQSLFEEQGRQLYGAQLLELQVKQKLNEQQIASLSSEKVVNEFLEFQRENITNIIKQMLAVGEIFRCENLQYPMDELVKEVQNSVAEFKRNNQEYDEDRVRGQVQDVMEGAKVLEWLRENSQIQYVYRDAKLAQAKLKLVLHMEQGVETSSPKAKEKKSSLGLEENS